MAKYVLVVKSITKVRGCFIFTNISRLSDYIGISRYTLDYHFSRKRKVFYSPDSTMDIYRVTDEIRGNQRVVKGVNSSYNFK